MPDNHRNPAEDVAIKRPPKKVLRQRLILGDRRPQPFMVARPQQFGVSGPGDEVFGGAQMLLMGRPAAPRGGVGEVESQFAADQSEGIRARRRGF